jgi:hypothetical protein
VSFLPSDKNTEFVYVPVPLGRVEDVYRLLAGQATESADASTALAQTVRRIYLESDEPFRNLLRFLADHPGQPMSTGEVAAALRLPNGAASLAGMLGAFARRSKSRYEGYWPFERLYNPGLNRAELMMENNVAVIVSGLKANS